MAKLYKTGNAVPCMRVAIVVSVVLLMIAMPSATIWQGSPGVGSHGSTAAQSLFPTDLFGNPLACTRNSGSQTPAGISPINIPAAGTGASATYSQEELLNNTAVNTTVTVPSGTGLFGPLDTNQYLALGAADPINSTSFAAIGIGMTSELDDEIAAPVAILPNTTSASDLIYSTSNTVSSGDVETLEINHVHGDWWEFTYNGNPITGSAGWQNGTYNLGVSRASGKICEEGATIGPSFLAVAFGDDGAGTPTLPTTSVPWAIGVEPTNSTSTDYIPADANAYPQFNKSQGTVGINGHDQSSSLGIDKLSVGSSVSYPGEFAPLWGNYKIVILNQSKVAPIQASLAFNGTQIFNATALTQSGANLPQAKFSWALSSPTLGTLNATSGPSVTLTAGSALASGHIWANVSYNCSLFVDEANITVTKTGGPSIDSFAATPDQVVLPPESDNNTTLKVVAGAWPFPITYKYTGLPSSCASSNSSTIMCNVSKTTSTGNYTVKVFLNDTKGRSSYATATLLVNPDLSIVSFKDSPAELTVNTTTSINTTAIGGIQPLLYNYTGMPPGCPNGRNTPVISCRPNATGKFNITVFVNDSVGHSVRKTVQLLVNVPLSIANFTIAPSTIDYGNSTTLKVSPAGGTPWSTGYNYSYLGLPKGCISANKSSITCTPTQAGNFTITANVTDSDGANAQSLQFLTVLAPTLPTIESFTATPDVVNVSQSTVLSVVVLGGTSPYSYAYTGLPGACSSVDEPTLTCTPSSSEAGNYSITVTVTDANKNQVTSTLKLEVKNPSGSGPSISSFTISPGTITLGASAVLTVTASGGKAPLSYAYSDLPTGCTTQDKDSWTCTPSAAGNVTVTVTVTDSASNSISATATLNVTPLSGGKGTPQISRFVADPAIMEEGNTTVFDVTATASETITYAYTGLPAGCSSSDTDSLPCTPTVSGNFTVRVYANDSSGSTTQTTVLSVTSTGQTTTSGSGGISTILIVLIIVAAAAVAVVAVIMLRKKKPSSTAPQQPPYAPSPYAPPPMQQQPGMQQWPPPPQQ